MDLNSNKEKETSNMAPQEDNCVAGTSGTAKTEASNTEPAAVSDQNSSKPVKRLTIMELQKDLDAYYAYLFEETLETDEQRELFNSYSKPGPSGEQPSVSAIVPTVEPEKMDDSEDEYEKYLEECQQWDQVDKPLIAYAQALIRNENPPPIYPELPVEHIDEQMNVDGEAGAAAIAGPSAPMEPEPERLFPVIDVFPFNTIIFVAVDPINININGDDPAVVARNLEENFPDYALEMRSPEEAIVYSTALRAVIDNFCNTRIDENAPRETFMTDFFNFFTNPNEDGALSLIGLAHRN